MEHAILFQQMAEALRKLPPLASATVRIAPGHPLHPLCDRLTDRFGRVPSVQEMIDEAKATGEYDAIAAELTRRAVENARLAPGGAT